MRNAQQMHTASKRSEIDGETVRAERRKGAQAKLKQLFLRLIGGSDEYFAEIFRKRRGTERN
jgi:hypothetical protein